MKNFEAGSATKPHLMWVYSGSLINELYAAQHLDTTHELRQLGWHVTLVTAGPADCRAIRGVEVRCIPMPEVYFVRQLIFHLKVILLIMQQRPVPQVILFHQNSVPWLLPLRFVRRWLGRRKMLFVMDTRTVHMPPKDKEGLKGRIRRVFLKTMNRLANWWVDGQTAITPRMAEVLHIPARQRWGVWPSGVTLERFSQKQTARRWPSAGEPIQLIYVGTLHYERNLMKLCEAVAQANAEGMAFQLVLTGDGTERADLETFATQTAGSIRVLPTIPHEQVPALLAQAHVGVLPFPDEEKFRVSSPIKLFEYMAAGLPILATRIVCHSEVVRDGTYAFWAEGGEAQALLAALRVIWQKREALSTMSHAAANAAHEWTWAEAAKKLKQALENGMAKFDDASTRHVQNEPPRTNARPSERMNYAHLDRLTNRLLSILARHRAGVGIFRSFSPTEVFSRWAARTILHRTLARGLR